MSPAVTGTDIVFRRNDHDRQPPRRVVTGLLMGDPQPGRLERAGALRLRVKPPRELPMPTSQVRR